MRGEWCGRASAVGRQVLAKWYSSAVSAFHVGQSAVTLTAPEHTMNLTHCARSTHVIGCAAAGRARGQLSEKKGA